MSSSVKGARLQFTLFPGVAPTVVGQSIRFELRTFDAQGRPIPATNPRINARRPTGEIVVLDSTFFVAGGTNIWLASATVDMVGVWEFNGQTGLPEPAEAMAKLNVVDGVQDGGELWPGWVDAANSAADAAASAEAAALSAAEAAANANYAPPGGSPLRPVSTHLNEGPRHVTAFGVVGDGIVDDTAAFLAAINSAGPGGTVFIPANVQVTLDNLVLPHSVTIEGSGRASFIKWRSGTSNRHMLRCTIAGAQVTLRNLTVDCNAAGDNGVGYYQAIRFLSVGTVTEPAALTIHDVDFLDGRSQTMLVIGDITGAVRSHLSVTNCRFLGGMESGDLRSSGDAQVRYGVDVIWSDNIHDQLDLRADRGRYGLLFQLDGTEPSAAHCSLTAHGNHFTDYGVADIDTLGCIDGYSGLSRAVVTGNVGTRIGGRFISIKADGDDVSIVGNVCDVTTGGVGIVMFEGKGFSIGANYIVANNVVGCSTGDAMDGMRFSGAAFTGVPPALYRDVTIANNHITGFSRHGIFLEDINGAMVSGGLIQTDAESSSGITLAGCTGNVSLRGVTIRAPSANTTGVLVFADCPAINLTISDCDVLATFRALRILSGTNLFLDSTTLRSATVGVEGSGLTSRVFADNTRFFGCLGHFSWGTGTAIISTRDSQGDTGTGFTASVLTLASGAVTPNAAVHRIDTEAAAATGTLTTINGGFEGRTITLFPANSARVVTLASGGNISLNVPVVLSVGRSVVLRFMGSTWLEVARSATSLGAQEANAVNITGGTAVLSNARVGNLVTTSRELNFGTVSGVGVFSTRMTFRLDATAETGSDAGSNFTWFTNSDTGAFLATIMSVTRATGVIALGSRPTLVNRGGVVTCTRGTTAQRPTGLTIGDGGVVQHMDTTLTKQVFWTGTQWIDAMGTPT